MIDFFFFKQKTAYEMRISDWSSDVCSSDLADRDAALATYEKAIQTAFQEVSDALARSGPIADQERAQEQLVASATDHYQLSDARYRGGVGSFLPSLAAQLSLYTAPRSLIATELTDATNTATLTTFPSAISLLAPTAARAHTPTAPPHNTPPNR